MRSLPRLSIGRLMGFIALFAVEMALFQRVLVHLFVATNHHGPRFDESGSILPSSGGCPDPWAIESSACSGAG